MDAGSMRGNLLNSQIEPTSPLPPLILKGSGPLVGRRLIIRVMRTSRTKTTSSPPAPFRDREDGGADHRRMSLALTVAPLSEVGARHESQPTCMARVKRKGMLVF
jgi:hypothetical protein